jgi:predicted dehydrogenase
MGSINNTQILMEFENKALATADISWLGSTTIFTMDVQGTGGHVLADINQDYYAEFHGSQTPVDDFRNFVKKMFNVAKGSLSGSLFKGGLAFHAPLIKDFVMSIEGDARIPVTGEEALQTVAVSEAAKRSLKENRIVPLKDVIKTASE